MGSDTKAEINDNQWIKKQVCVLTITTGSRITVYFAVQIWLLTESLAKLQQEVDMLEQRNLQLMETVNSHQRMEVEATRKVFAASAEARMNYLWGSSACSSQSGSSVQLPSLTDNKPRHSSELGQVIINCKSTFY